MKELTRTEYSARNTTVAIISRVIAILMGYAVRVVFTAVLSTSYVGVSGLFTDIVTILSLSELGMETAITFALYGPIARKDVSKIKSIMALYKKLYTYVAVIIILAGLCLIPFLGIITGDPGDVSDIRLIYCIYLANTALSYFFIYRKTLMDASQIRYVGVAWHTVFLVLQDIGQILVLLLTKDFILFLLIYLACTLGYNLATSYSAAKRYPYLKDKDVEELPAEEKKGIFKNIRAMLMHKVGTIIVNNTDNILLSAMTGLANAGIYANNFLVFSSIRQVLNEAFDSITASVGNLSVTEDETKAKKIFDCAFFVNQWLFGFASICIFELLSPFCKLSFGARYGYEFFPMLVITLNFFVTGMRRATIVYRDACGLFYYDRYKAVVEAVVNLVASVLFTLWLGFVGVFIGTFVATMTTSFWVEPYVLYKYKLHAPLSGYFKHYALYSAVFGLCCFLTAAFSGFLEKLIGIRETELIPLLLFRLLFCTVFVNLFYLLCFFRKKEFALVLEKARFILERRRKKKNGKKIRLLPEEKAALELLESSLTGKESNLSESELNAGRLYELSKAHAVLPLLYDPVRSITGGEGELYERVQSAARQTALQSYHLLFLSRQICNILEEAGLRVAVLKGAAVSSFYPVPEYRKSGDIDILLCEPERREEAVHAMEKAGYRLNPVQPALHQIIMSEGSGVEVELHVMLAEPFDNRRINDFTASLLPEIKTHITEKKIMGVSLPVLDSDYQPFELLLHMLQHFLRRGFGLKLLCDWTAYWNSLPAEERGSIRRYRELIAACGLTGFSDMITAVCGRFLGLRSDCLPGLLSSEKEKPGRGARKAFLREVFDGGEFGNLEKERMVILRGRGISAYTREFHHQMHLNFPRAGKVMLLWPVLWIITLCRFLHNNAVVRHTSGFRILKKSGERSRILRQIRLWKR